MMSQNHMLAVISRPEPSLAKHFTSLQSHRGKFSCCFLPGDLNNPHQSACFFELGHQSRWMELRPLAVSPARQRYRRSRWPLSCGSLRVIWHLSHSHLLRDPRAADLRVCVLGLTWHVCKWDRVRKREREERPCLTTPTTDQSGGGEKWTNQPLQWWNLTQFISKLTGVG